MQKLESKNVTITKTKKEKNTKNQGKVTIMENRL